MFRMTYTSMLSLTARRLASVVRTKASAATKFHRHNRPVCTAVRARACMMAACRAVSGFPDFFVSGWVVGDEGNNRLHRKQGGVRWRRGAVCGVEKIDWGQKEGEGTGSSETGKCQGGTAVNVSRVVRVIKSKGEVMGGRGCRRVCRVIVEDAASL